jgi:hypothetical protein
MKNTLPGYASRWRGDTRDRGMPPLQPAARPGVGAALIARRGEERRAALEG